MLIHNSGRCSFPSWQVSPPPVVASRRAFTPWMIAPAPLSTPPTAVPKTSPKVTSLATFTEPSGSFVSCYSWALKWDDSRSIKRLRSFRNCRKHQFGRYDFTINIWKLTGTLSQITQVQSICFSAFSLPSGRVLRFLWILLEHPLPLWSNVSDHCFSASVPLLCFWPL